MRASLDAARSSTAKASILTNRTPRSSILHSKPIMKTQKAVALLRELGLVLLRSNTIFERCSTGSTGGCIGATQWTHVTLTDVHVRASWSLGNGGEDSLTVTTALPLRGRTTIQIVLQLPWAEAYPEIVVHVSSSPTEPVQYR